MIIKISLAKQIQHANQNKQHNTLKDNGENLRIVGKI
jgi:hypothetical protein